MDFLISSEDLLVSIFSFLDAHTLCASSQVCHFWHQLAADDLFWKPIYLSRFPIPAKRLALRNMAHVVQVVHTHIIGRSEWKPLFMSKIQQIVEQKLKDGVIDHVEQCFPTDNFPQLITLIGQFQKLLGFTNENFVQKLRQSHSETASRFQTSLDFALRTDAIGCAAVIMQLGFRTNPQSTYTHKGQLLVANLDSLLFKFSQTGANVPVQVTLSTRLIEIIDSSTIKSADLGAARSLLNAGANVNFVCNVITKDTLLHQAVMHGNLDLIQLLLEFGAKSVPNATGRLPLNCTHPLRFPCGHFEKIKEIFDRMKEREETQVEH